MEARLAETTLAQMFWNRVEGDGPCLAQLVKRGGEWRRLTWSEVGTAVRQSALGFLALGVRSGEPVALLSRSRAEWVHADFAVLSIGGVTVPIYPTYTPEQVACIVNDSGARTLIVEDASQLAKTLEVRAKMPALEHIVVIEGDDTHEPPVVSWESMQRAGQRHATTLQAVLAERVTAARPEDIATIVYTSGTTGEPKGVVQTHGNHMAALEGVARVPGLEPGDVHLLFLPLAHSFARLEAFMGVHRRLVTAFAEGLDHLGDNLREVRPHFVFAVPRVFEKLQARMLADVENRSVIARSAFAWAMRLGRACAQRQQVRQALPTPLVAARWIADRAVFAKLHAALGGRLKFAVSGGAPLGRDLGEFFHAAGVLILEGYGLTEACPALTFNRVDHFRFGSVGQPIAGVEIKIAPDGEILARGPNVAVHGYHRRPTETRETFAEGWLRTGDIGHLDEDGFLYITDRKKELIVTSGGSNIAPQPVEEALKRDRLIAHAVICGDRRPYLVALIAVDRQEVVQFARARGLLLTDYAALARHPGVAERVGETVETVNRGLPSYARIRRFALTPGEFSEEGGGADTDPEGAAKDRGREVPRSARVPL
jgi:long-chain acyl-CoA synthetase